jgi:hypothetical protein
MKKLLFIFFLLLPISSIAQDFATLKKQADVFYKKGKYNKAAPLYAKAIERVVTYREKVKNSDWELISIASEETDRKINNLITPQYVHVKYGASGEILNNKIADLKARGVKSIFTYRVFGGYSVSSYLMIDPISKATVNIGSSWDRKYLIWADNYKVFMQPFDSFNVYPSVQTDNKVIFDICQFQYDQLLKEDIKALKNKDSEQTAYEFNFYDKTGAVVTKTFDDGDFIDPVKRHPVGRPVNRDTYYKESMVNYAKNFTTSLGQLFLLLKVEIQDNFPGKVN